MILLCPMRTGGSSGLMLTLAKRERWSPRKQIQARQQGKEVMMGRDELFKRWLLSGKYVPLMGADGDGDDGDGDGTSGDKDGDKNGDADEGDDEDGDGDGDGDKDGDGDEEDDDDASKLRVQNKQLETRLAKAEKAAADAKKEAREARRKAAAGTGDTAAVLKEREAELADEREAKTKLEAERDKAVSDLDSYRREVRVTRIASKMGFKDPGDAIALLDSDNTGDDKSAERALRQLVDSKPYLVDPAKATGRSASGSGNGKGGLTMDEIRRMSPEEIAARKPEVDAAMRASRARSGA